MIQLGYRPPDYEARPKVPGKIRLLKFKNFCPYKIDLDFYKEARKNFSFDEWLRILPGAIDYNAAGYERDEEKLTMLTRLLPFVEKRLNLIELAPKQTARLAIPNEQKFLTCCGSCPFPKSIFAGQSVSLSVLKNFSELPHRTWP